MSNGQTAFFFKDTVSWEYFTKFRYSLRHKTERLVKARKSNLVHIKDMAQLFSNSSRALPTSRLLHSLCFLLKCFSMTYEDQLLTYILPCMCREFQARKEFECKCFGRFGCMFS